MRVVGGLGNVWLRDQGFGGLRGCGSFRGLGGAGLLVGLRLYGLGR